MKKKNKVDGGVVILSKNTLNCVQYKALTPKAKLVFIAMQTDLWRDKDDNPDNKVKIAQSRIEELTGLKRSTIYRATQELKEKKFVKVDIEDQGGLERNTTIYKLNGRYLYF